MTARKADYMFKNGLVWDQMLFSTSEDQIKSGWIQSLDGARSYRKFPGGHIHNFGYADLTTSASGLVTQTISLPLAFPRGFLSLTGGIYEVGDSTWTVGTLVLTKVGLNQVKIIVNGAAPNKIFRVSFDAWGF